MQLINWLELQPLLSDVDTLNGLLKEAQPVQSVCRFLVDVTLGGYPWLGRSDLIPSYHPSRTYRPGQWIALPVEDPRKLRATAWQVAQVKQAETTANPVQGRFQALVLDVSGKEIYKPAGIAGATYPEPGLSNCSSEERGWLVDWLADTYAGSLLSTLKRLIHKGRICGQLSGDTYLPEQLFALSIERLQPFFARLSPVVRWVSIEEIRLGLPDLSNLKSETARALIRSTLKVSPYRALGGDRWTTPELYDQWIGQIPCGLPERHSRSKSQIWTPQDKRDLAACSRKPMPVKAARALEELGLEQRHNETGSAPWQSPAGRMSLPALTLLPLTQAYFPLGQAWSAFAPDAGMVFIQFIEGEYRPYLLDREHGFLMATHAEELQAQILKHEVPVGTHLWLEYHGGEKYRISPQLLPTEKLSPCKLASLDQGRLQIVPGHISMKYESDDPLFLARLDMEDLKMLSDQAGASNMSVRETLIQVVQEISLVDPNCRAHLSEILNAVLLKRVCSPQAVILLLYTDPCFTHWGGDYFRYTPLDGNPVDIFGGANLASRLWEDLVANHVAPDPISRRMAIGNMVSGQGDAPGRELSQPVELPVRSSSIHPIADIFGGGGRGRTALEKITMEPIHRIKQVLEYLTAPPVEELLNTENQEETPELAIYLTEHLEQGEVQMSSVDAGLVLNPVYVKIPNEYPCQQTSVIDTRRVAYGLKIPARPLHKRPFYQRFLFCLGGWIRAISRRSHEPYLR